MRPFTIPGSQPPIVGDPQENDRMALEQAISRGLPDFSAPSPSISDDKSDFSVEYPRHGGAHSPLPFNPYSSYGRAGPADFDEINSIPDQHHPHHRSFTSYRDDSFAAGETVSTAAHHASGLTLRAGLRYNNGSPSTGSPFSANGEYDPDRPLQQLLENRGHMSMFDETIRSIKPDRKTNTSAKNRSANKTSEFKLQTTPFNPIIVDNPAELDRAVEQGQIQLNNIPSIPQVPISRPHPRDDDDASVTGSESSSFRRSEPPTPRIKLSEALDRATGERLRPFSPSRQAFRASSPIQKPSYSSLGQPSTTNPPPTSSRFGRAAKGLSKEIEEALEDPQLVDYGTPARRNPLTDIANHVKAETHRPTTTPRRSAKPKAGTSVYLPDVTGLTSAVGSPIQGNVSYMGVKINYRDPTSVNAAIEELATRLEQVARENTTSRRRVRELELELDVCKAEVTRERTRVQEEMQKQRERSFTDKKGKGRADSPDHEENALIWEARYREVVEEKKALEALVNTLNSRLARATTDLAASQKLIEQLKSLRERDARDVQQKCEEIDLLRDEVERLTEEIGRLKSVVEDGLRERRMTREMEELRAREAAAAEEEYMAEQEAQRELQRGQLSIVEEDEQEEFLDDSRGPREHYRYQTSHPQQEYDGFDTEPEDEVDHGEQVAAQEMTIEYTLPEDYRHEYRPDSAASNTSLTRSASSVSGDGRQTYGGHRGNATNTSSRGPSPQPSHGLPPSDQSMFRRAPSRMSTKTPDLKRDDDETSISSVGRPLPARSRRFITDEELARLEADIEERRSERSNQSIQERSFSRASDPGVPAHRAHHQAPQERNHKSKLTRHHSSPAVAAAASSVPPVPRLRGKRAEKLFWSSSPHNEQTCSKCHKRKDTSAGQARDGQKDQEWLARFLSRRKRHSHGHGESGSSGEEMDRLPPQTVLARVITELEDEFTHYKSIYIELAEQYALMDAVSNVPKRNVLAEHLREVIDTLEQKGDQIASLYDLLAFKDRPTDKSRHP